MHLFPIVPTDIKTVPNSSIRHTEHTPLLLENIEFPETEITLTGDPYTIQDKSFDDACIEYVKAKDDYLVWNIGRPSDEILKACYRYVAAQLTLKKRVTKIRRENHPLFKHRDNKAFLEMAETFGRWLMLDWCAFLNDTGVSVNPWKLNEPYRRTQKSNL
jgi:hypothetical protein